MDGDYSSERQGTRSGHEDELALRPLAAVVREAVKIRPGGKWHPARIPRLPSRLSRASGEIAEHLVAQAPPEDIVHA